MELYIICLKPGNFSHVSLKPKAAYQSTIFVVWCESCRCAIVWICNYNWLVGLQTIAWESVTSSKVWTGVATCGQIDGQVATNSINLGQFSYQQS